MAYQHITPPKQGEKITANKDFTLNVPHNPIIPFIEGDGIGVDITPVMQRVVDEAVKKAYGNKRAIQWMEIYAGEKATKVYGKESWLPQETIEAMRDYVIAIKRAINNTCGWGNSLLECDVTPRFGFVCLFTPCALFQRGPESTKRTVADKHGDFS